MRIAVTGQHGQLARSIVELGAIHGADVLTLGRPEFDLSKLDAFTAVLDRVAPDLVVNAAAYTAVDKAETDQDAALLNNGAAAGALAAACAKRGIPIIQISTDYVFDGTKASAYDETDAPGPLNVYGASKLLGEQLVASSNPRHLIMRTSWVVSPHGQNFVKTMLRLGAERETVGVVDDQRGAPTYAPHLAAAVMKLAVTMAEAPPNDTRWGLYHATNTGETTWHGVARAIFDLAAAKGVRTPILNAIPSSAYPTPARRPANSRLDTRLLATTFGVTLPDWQDGVRECVGRLLTVPVS